MSELFYKAAGAVLAPFRYAEREVKQMKEEAKEDIQAYIAKAIKISIMAVAGLMFLLFLSIMAANWINAVMESDVAGFAIMAGFYLIIALILFAIKDSGDKKKHTHHGKSIRPV